MPGRDRDHLDERWGRLRALLDDEFSLLAENAAEAGLAFDGPPPVRRVQVGVGGGRQLSAISWGEEPPEVVLVHGGAQNAHTWDTVALALARPLVAVDLPGHGRSDWRQDHDYSPRTNSADLEVAIETLAPDAALVVGMSLGGLSALALAARRPDLVARLALVDVTPGTDRDKAAPIASFVAGPESFASFEEILERTIAFNPTRSEASLRRGVLHNALERADGRWVWRYDRTWSGDLPRRGDFVDQWTDVDRLRMPVLLVRGGRDSSVVDEHDAAELARRCPTARVEVVEDAGHSIQGDQPVTLARLLARFVSEGV